MLQDKNEVIKLLLPSDQRELITNIREKKARNGIYLLKFLSKYVSKDILNKLYVRPHLDYGDVIYYNQRANVMDLLEQVQYKAALAVSGC